jgi:hypothetical protein
MRRWYQRKTREQRLKWVALRDREKVRARDRERHHRKKVEAEYKRRRRAVFIVNREIGAGRLERGACEVCGEVDAHAHHEDYDLPMDVRWLCPQHHADVHAEAA